MRGKMKALNDKINICKRNWNEEVSIICVLDEIIGN